MIKSRQEPCEKHDDAVTLKGYFERIIREHQEAIRIAEQEREKTAANVRRALEADMKSGDERLQDHITHQIEQVKQGLDALNAILVERDGRSADRWKAQERQFIEFKESVIERFKGANEFRAAMGDLTKTMATTKELDAIEEKIMPLIERNREDVTKKVGQDAFQSATNEWTIWRTGVDKWRNELAGKGEGIGSTARVVMTVAVFVATLLGIVSFFLAVNNSNRIEQSTGRIINQSQPAR